MVNRLFVLYLAVVIAGLAAGLIYSAAYAQDPTPTPEPTPQYQYQLEVEPGVTVMLERRITYGEIAVVTAALLVVIVLLVNGLLILSKLWFQ